MLEGARLLEVVQVICFARVEVRGGAVAAFVYGSIVLFHMAVAGAPRDVDLPGRRPYVARLIVTRRNAG